MRANLKAALAFTFKAEGGFVDNPHDPGGATNKGVTLHRLREWRHDDSLGVQDIRTLTAIEATQIYVAGYWHPVQGDRLPAGLDLTAFDMGVNAGPGRSAKILQGVIGVPQDGDIGPFTLATTQQVIHRRGTSPVIDDIAEAQIAYYRGLPDAETFIDGWTNRVHARAAAAKALLS